MSQLSDSSPWPGSGDGVHVGDYRKALRSALSAESRAYGFTLVVWGGGSLLMSEHGLPGRSGAVAFVAGLLAGVSAAIFVSFRGPAHALSSGDRRPGAGGVHLGSVATALAAAWVVGLLVPSHWLAYLLGGLAAGLGYQLVLGLEIVLSGGGRQSCE